MTYLGVDLHCEEETEVGVWSQTVKFLLELDKPLRSQVNVLQHHPAAGLGRRVDSLVRLTEAFRRPCRHKHKLVTSNKSSMTNLRTDMSNTL